MCRRIGLVVFFLLCASASSAHDPFVLDARRAEPGGIQLALLELPRAAASGTIRYQLQAVGVPRGTSFGVFTKDFAHSFHEVASGFQADKSGNLVSSAADEKRQPQRLYEMVLHWLSKPWAAWRKTSQQRRLEEVVFEP